MGRAKAFIGAAAMVRFGKYGNLSAPELGRAAVKALVADNDIDVARIGAVSQSGCAVDTGRRS
jgi:acetyl-CoA acetyltransferase